MTSSDRLKTLQPLGARRPSLDEPARPPTAYARFIPREEVGPVTAWQPGSFTGPDRRVGDRRAAQAPAPAPSTPAADDGERARLLTQAVEQARQGGYRDGYRDGLVALENFKQSYAQQVSAQVAQVVVACQAQLDALQATIADSVAHTAVAIARQVVRQELSVEPALVAAVAREAVEALLASARHLTLRVHPDDATLVAQGAGETLAARQVRLVPDATVERGGCQLEADIARIDASMPTRWQRAVAQVGLTSPWAVPDDAGVPDTAVAGPAQGPNAESAGALDRTPGRTPGRTPDRTPDPASGGASEAPAP